MRIVGMTRCKNEARWLRRVLESYLPLCETLYLFDDNSDDGSPDIAAEVPRVNVLRSPFSGINEARDKGWLLERVLLASRPDWIVHFDSDELLDPGSIGVLKKEFVTTTKHCLSLRVKYLWDREDQVRVDGVYGDFRRQSAFIPGRAKFESRGEGPNYHIGNVPRALWMSCGYPEASLLHLGYMAKDDRVRKYEFYNRTDPNNEREGRYQHMVIGDLFPADSKFKHGGPLELRPL